MAELVILPWQIEEKRRRAKLHNKQTLKKMKEEEVKKILRTVHEDHVDIWYLYITDRCTNREYLKSKIPYKEFPRDSFTVTKEMDSIEASTWDCIAWDLELDDIVFQMKMTLKSWTLELDIK